MVVNMKKSYILSSITLGLLCLLASLLFSKSNYTCIKSIQRLNTENLSSNNEHLENYICSNLKSWKKGYLSTRGFLFLTEQAVLNLEIYQKVDLTHKRIFIYESALENMREIDYLENTHIKLADIYVKQPLFEKIDRAKDLYEEYYQYWFLQMVDTQEACTIMQEHFHDMADNDIQKNAIKANYKRCIKAH